MTFLLSSEPGIQGICPLQLTGMKLPTRLPAFLLTPVESAATPPCALRPAGPLDGRAMWDRRRLQTAENRTRRLGQTHGHSLRWMPAGGQAGGVRPAGGRVGGVRSVGGRAGGVRPAGGRAGGVRPAGGQAGGVRPAGTQTSLSAPPSSVCGVCLQRHSVAAGAPASTSASQPRRREEQGPAGLAPPRRSSEDAPRVEKLRPRGKGSPRVAVLLVSQQGDHASHCPPRA